MEITRIAMYRIHSVYTLILHTCIIHVWVIIITTLYNETTVHCTVELHFCKKIANVVAWGAGARGVVWAWPTSNHS